MKRFIQLAAAVAVSFQVGGCARMVREDSLDPTSMVREDPLDARILGVVAECHLCPDRYAFADSGKTQHKNVKLEESLAFNDDVKSEQYPKLQVSRTVNGTTYDFQAVFGRNFGATSGNFLVQVKEGDGGRPYLELDDSAVDGWVLMWGLYPWAYTSWCNAAGDNTTVLVQYVDASTHRIFLLGKYDNGGDWVDVKCGTTTARIDDLGLESNDKGMYLDVTTGCVIRGPYNVEGAGAAVEDFVREAIRIAHTAGMPVADAPGWPDV